MWTRLTAFLIQAAPGGDGGGAPAGGAGDGGGAGAGGGGAPGGAAGAGDGQQPQNPMEMFYIFAIVMVIFWLVVFLPESRKRKKREKERAEKLAAVKKGDQVLTTSGIFGKVTKVDERHVTIRIDDDKDCKMRILKTAIFETGTSDDLEVADPHQPQQR